MTKKDIFCTLEEIAASIDGVKGRKHAAMVVRNNRVLGVGFNGTYTDPFQKKFGRNKESLFIHAETSAIKASLRKVDRLARPNSLTGADLYVLRVSLDGQRAMSLPCIGCRKAIVTFGIRNVYYTNREGEVEKCKIT